MPKEIKDRISVIAHDLCVSQSAVWKILISRYLRPVIEGDLEDALLSAAAPGGEPRELRRVDGETYKVLRP